MDLVGNAQVSLYKEEFTTREKIGILRDKRPLYFRLDSINLRNVNKKSSNFDKNLFILNCKLRNR